MNMFCIYSRLPNKGGGRVRIIGGWKWLDLMIIGGWNNRCLEKSKITVFLAKHASFIYLCKHLPTISGSVECTS